MLLAHAARQRIIFASAQLLSASWILTVIAWRFLDGAQLHVALVMQDATLAYVFFQMSRGRWFPVALFAIHVVMLAHNVFIAAFGVPDAFVGLFLNRLFELALVYVGGCAVYRIHARRMDALSAKVRRQPPPE